MKKPSSSSSDTIFRSDASLITRQLLDRLAIFILFFGAFAAAGSISRIFQFGWKINIIIDFCTYLLMVTIVYIRRYISPLRSTALILTIVSIDAACNITSMGFTTGSIIMLCTCGVITGVIFGFRAGVSLITGSTIFMSLIAILYIMNILHPIFDPQTAIHSPYMWISHTSGFLVFSLACLTVVHFIKEKLIANNVDLRVRSNELHVSERKFRLLAENMHDILLLVNQDLHITYISPSVEKTLGFTPKELIDRRIDILAPVEKSAFILTFFTKVISQNAVNRSPHLSFECQLTNNKNTSLPAEFSPSPIFSSNGEVTGIQCIIRDLTYQKKAEEEKKQFESKLRHSEKLEVIGQLAGGIAHDFNNQLAGILGFAELIKSEHAQSTETWSIAQSIASIAKHSTDLTSKLLAFARKGNYRVEVIDLHQLINEISQILSRSIDRSITIDNQLDASTPFTRGDPGQIQNALLNIALNARDAMHQGGTLSFRTQLASVDATFTTAYQHDVTPGDYIRITISDTGTGIDDATKEHLFEPFFTTKAPGEGTGMGLAAVYGTIQTHGGILDVTSTVNEGTSFHIYLPLSTDTPSSTEQDTASMLVRGQGNILVIEDEKSVAKMMEMVLKHLGYTVVIRNNGTEGLSYYTQHYNECTAVIIDLILPGMNGKDLLNGIRAIDKNSRILICSGYRADINIQKLIEDTQTLFIQKPFTMNEISRMLGELLQSTNGKQ